jgi:ankyrin repeat protein
MPTRDLPNRPNLEQYKKQAKELTKSRRRQDPGFKLADAQLAIAREHGFQSWAKFAKRIDAVLGDASPDAIWARAEQAVVAGNDAALEALLREHAGLLRNERPKSSWLGGLSPDYREGDARAIITATHHFDRWEQFAVFRDARQEEGGSIARFETAVEAIVSGDLHIVKRLLDEDPQLIRARSVRAHRSTLLHYIGANGVEGFRQRTPRNAVEMATLLLDAGADVDARADMYGGSTTLGLVATSEHPKTAGLQQPLIELLLARGARMDQRGTAGHQDLLVRACLANGRPEAAAFVAARGAPLDLESAAGIGRLDVVARFFDDGGHLSAGATRKHMEDGYGWACVYGHTRVVDFLVRQGIAVNLKVRAHGEGCTGLHLAAYHGDSTLIRLLLGHGAQVDISDDTWHTTPLTWALYAWSEDPTLPSDRYYEVVSLLVSAGAAVRSDLLEWDKVKGDVRMLSMLRRV